MGWEANEEALTQSDWSPLRWRVVLLQQADCAGFLVADRPSAQTGTKPQQHLETSATHWCHPLSDHTTGSNWTEGWA